MSKKADAKIHKDSSSNNHLACYVGEENHYTESPDLCETKMLKVDISHTDWYNTPEQQLWCAVILRAVEDLFFVPKLRNTKAHYAVEQIQIAKNVRKSAYSFLFANAPLFAEHRRFVFESAGMAMLEMRELRARADRFEVENS